MNEFNKDFNKSTNRIFGLTIVVILIGWVVGLSLLGGLVYVAWHFISKVW